MLSHASFTLSYCIDKEQREVRDKTMPITPVTKVAPSGTSVEDDSLLIDCDLCDYSGSSTCDDCLVTYLCRPDRNSVVIELADIRALRKLGRSGLIPELKLRKSVGLDSDR